VRTCRQQGAIWVSGEPQIFSRVPDFEFFEIISEKSIVAGEQAIGMRRGVCTDEEVGDDSASPACALEILAFRVRLSFSDLFEVIVAVITEW